MLALEVKLIWVIQLDVLMVVSVLYWEMDFDEFIDLISLIFINIEFRMN